MTIGIYKLNFKGTDKVYIGQSINIEERYTTHKRRLLNNTSSKKLIEAYNLYGIPSLEIIEECTIDNIDEIETKYIYEFNSIDNGFNTFDSNIGHSKGIGVRGANNVKALYSKNTYIEILFLLIDPTLTHKKIAELTNTKIGIVQSISSLSKHKWLEEEFPKEYEILRNMKYNRDLLGDYEYKGGNYSLVSPEGIVHYFDNANDFAKSNKLNNGWIYQLLNGTIKKHKGWTRNE